MAALIIAFILALATAAFALQNTDAVIMKFLIWQYQTSLVLVILASAMSGVILALLASLGSRWRDTRTKRSLDATVKSQGERIRELEHQLRSAHEAARPPASDK